MSDLGITAPRQIEYVILPPRRRKVARIVAALCVAFTMVGGLVLFLHNQTPAHAYRDLPLPASGLKASLRTKWIDGTVRYIFYVSPSEGNESRFTSVLQTIPRDQLKFTVQLLDADGFKVCSGSPTMHSIIGADGKPVGMRADEALSNCSEEQMKAAPKWNVTHRFPLLAAELTPLPKVPAPSVLPRSTMPLDLAMSERSSVVTSTFISSQLTGSDFVTGELETLNQGSFKVSKRAEYLTLMGWQSPDSLELSCKQQACVVTNLRTKEIVHAKKR